RQAAARLLLSSLRHPPGDAGRPLRRGCPHPTVGAAAQRRRFQRERPLPVPQPPCPLRFPGLLGPGRPDTHRTGRDVANRPRSHRREEVPPAPPRTVRRDQPMRRRAAILCVVLAAISATAFLALRNKPDRELSALARVSTPLDLW